MPLSRLLGNALRMLSGTIVAQVLAALAVIVAARNTLPVELGPVVGFVGLVSLGATVADFGLNSLTIRTLAADPSDLDAFRTTLSVKVVMAGTLGLAWILACLVALSLGAPENLIVPAIPLGVYLGAWVVSSTLAVPFRSAQQFGPVAAALAFERCVLLAVTVVLMEMLRIGAVGFGLAYMADGLAALLFLYVLTDRRLLVFARPSLSTFLATWRSSVMFGLSSLAAQIQKADVAVVAATAGAVASGIYAIPARVTTPISTLVGSFTAAMFPMVASGSRAAKRHALLGSALTFLVTVAGVGLLWIFADEAVSTLLGPLYRGAVPVLRIVLVATVLASVNQLVAVYLQATGDERYVATVVLAAAVGGLIAVGVGASFGGPVGGAWGTVLQQAAILAALMGRLGLRNQIGSRAQGGGWRESIS